MNKQPKLENLRRAPDSQKGVTMEKFSGRLPSDILDRVTAEAEAEGIKPSHRIRQILTAFYADKDK
jgi:hypothetical protein